MKQLHALNLLDSGITAVGAEELRTTLPNCRVIHPSVAHIPPTSRGRKVRLRRVTFEFFAQLTDSHTISVLLNP